MNYDKAEIPATYDKARALSPETRRLWQDLLSVHVDRAEISLVIDLGCGTGRFSELLAAHFGVPVIGIDPSMKMLDQARRKPAIGNVVYCQGLAEALPFRDGCADLVFMSMAVVRISTSGRTGMISSCRGSRALLLSIRPISARKRYGIYPRPSSCFEADCVRKVPGLVTRLG